VYLAIKAYYAKLHEVKFNIITAMTRIIVSWTDLRSKFIFQHKFKSIQMQNSKTNLALIPRLKFGFEFRLIRLFYIIICSCEQASKNLSS
jgi:hypothetical protein